MRNVWCSKDHRGYGKNQQGGLPIPAFSHLRFSWLTAPGDPEPSFLYSFASFHIHQNEYDQDLPPPRIR
jgi:hypothetical protein